MPGYLDNNIYTGAGNAASQMGDAFTRAIVGTQALRYQQAQLQQQQAMEAARLELERQKLLQNAPLVTAQTDEAKALAGLNQGRLQDIQTGAKAGGILGDVMKGIGETDATRNPQTMQLLQAIAAQQQAILAAQNPQNIARQTADIQLGMSPEGRRFVSAGYPTNQNQRQYPSPEQSAALEVLLEGMRLAGHPTTTTRPSDLGPVRTEEVDAGRALNLGQLGLQQIFPGSTNRYQFATEEPAPTPAPAQQGGFVVVTNPKGQKVRIRAEQLQEALQQGYKQ